jgi:hypothetical protein
VRVFLTGDTGPIIGATVRKVAEGKAGRIEPGIDRFGDVVKVDGRKPATRTKLGLEDRSRRVWPRKHRSFCL